MTTPIPRIYPGMLCTSKEYFNSGKDVMMIHNGTVQNFDDVPEHPELAKIIDEETELQEILQKWFGDNDRQKQKTLARCRFGALNFMADFNEDEVSDDFCRCPHRGKCAGENIVCKPAKVFGENLETEEIEILRECSGNDTNRTIAARLGLPLGTFNVKKNRIYERLALKTKQHAALMIFFEGLL